MKRLYILTITIFFLFSSTSIWANPNNTSETDVPKEIIDSLLSNVDTPCAPRIFGDYIIFTANEDPRFTGIAFDFENFVKIHPFKRLNTYDFDGTVTKSVLFYITKIPEDTQQIAYRLIIDGLWTTDSLNSSSYFNTKMQVELSTVKIPYKPDNTTKNTKSNTVRFVYEGTSGQEIRLGGSFTNWDSWIYEMKETKPGLYELEIPLPTGTWYYNFYSGSIAIIDKNNPNRGYTADGRTSSVITIN